MRIAIFAPALAAALSAGCGPMLPDGPPEERAQFIADNFDTMARWRLGDEEAEDISARAEGDLLILSFRNQPHFSGTITSFSAQRQIKQEVCSHGSYRSVIESGVRIRIEMKTTQGRDIPPATIAFCD